jgi:hypothetical protein
MVIKKLDIYVFLGPKDMVQVEIYPISLNFRFIFDQNFIPTVISFDEVLTIELIIVPKSSF